jgi:hypothetical protein
MAEPKLCTQCGSVTTPKTVSSGSGWITLVFFVCALSLSLISVVLSAFAIIMFVVYVFWRHSNSYSSCRKCGSKNLVPMDSPFAKDLVATRPSIAASVIEQKKEENDMLVGGMILGGILLIIILIFWLKS